MKKTNTKRTLAMSLISLLACGVMFAGSTYAWFTDEVVASGNKIETGTLKADMEVLKGSDWVSLKDNPETKIFDYDKWEPGYTASTSLRILNEGTLGFRYQVLGEFDGETFGPNGESLTDVIDVYMYANVNDPQEVPAISSFEEVKAAAEANPDNTRANGWYKIGTLAQWMQLPYGLTAGYMLPEGDTTYTGPLYGYNGVGHSGYTATIVLHMQEEAGNEYQGLSLGDINLTLKATQWTYEKDGFGNNKYDDAATIKNEAQLIAALQKGGEIELGAPVALDEVVKVTADTVINLNGYDLDTSACAKRPFELNNGADLTINAVNSNIKAGNYGLVYIPDGESKVVLNGGNYTSNMDNGSFIKPKGSAKVDIELNKVNFADSSNDSYIIDGSSYEGSDLNITVNGGTYSANDGFILNNADVSISGAKISVVGLAFEAGYKTALSIENSELIVNYTTLNLRAPNSCVALSGGQSSVVVTNSVLTSNAHVFANFSGANTLTYSGCEINHTGDLALLNIYENSINPSSLVVNGEKIVTVNSTADFVAALADTTLGYVALGSDLVLNEEIAIAADRDLVLDLNGCDISTTISDAKASALISNSGNLTITGEGTLEYTSTAPSAGYGYSTSTIINKGTLTIDGGNFTNKTVGGASYVIDNAPGATLEVNGGSFHNNGIVIRAYQMDGWADNNIVINGGEIVSENSRAIQAHIISSSNKNAAPIINITINGGKLATKVENGIAVYSYSAGTALTGTTITLNGGVIDGWVALDGGEAKAYGKTVVVVSDACTILNGDVFSYAD